MSIRLEAVNSMADSGATPAVAGTPISRYLAEDRLQDLK
jgi:hypothetical protein